MTTFSSRLIWLWPSLVLGTLGLTQLHACWSGKMQGLLHPTFHPFILISGIILTTLALVRVLVSTPVFLPKISRGAWIQLLSGALLVGTVIGMQKAAPLTGYSSLAFDNRGLEDRAMPIMSSTYNQTAAQEVSDPSGVLQCEVVDLLMAASDPDLVKSLEGRKVHFIGQFMPLDGNNFEIVRLLMYCCAADAQPVGLQIKGNGGGLQKMDWAEINGTVHFIPDDKAWKVDLQLDKIGPIPTPKEIYLY